MKNRLIYEKKVKQIVIDAELHRQLKILAATRKSKIKTLVEAILEVFLAKENNA